MIFHSGSKVRMMPSSIYYYIGEAVIEIESMSRSLKAKFYESCNNDEENFFPTVYITVGINGKVGFTIIRGLNSLVSLINNLS